MKEQIQIVMATYNGEKYLKEQLNSLITQSYPDIQINVYDDGSTDQTISIVKEYEKKDNRIRLIQNKENKGYVRNFMTGVKQSDSSYIMLCDQDDIWEKDKVELTFEMMKRAERENAGKPILVFTDAMNYASDTGKKIGRFHEMSHLDVKKVDTAHLFMENKCIGCTIMINRKVLSYLDELPDEIRVHDWWLALVCSHFGVVSYLPEATLLYRQHAGNQIGGNSFLQYMKNRISQMKKQHQVVLDTYQQGKAFYRLFEKEIPADKKKVAKEFAAMADAGFIGRRYRAIRYGFWKSGLIRNVGLFFLL